MEIEDINKTTSSRSYYRFLMVTTSVVFCFMLFVVFLQVVNRFLFTRLGFSLKWTEEAARYILIYVTFFGSGVAWFTNDHIVITLVTDLLPKRVNKFIECTSCAIIFILLVALMFGSLGLIKRYWISPVGSIRWLKRGHLFLIVSIGIFLNILGAGRCFWVKFKEAKSLTRKGVKK